MSIANSISYRLNSIQINLFSIKRSKKFIKRWKMSNIINKVDIFDHFLYIFLISFDQIQTFRWNSEPLESISSRRFRFESKKLIKRRFESDSKCILGLSWFNCQSLIFWFIHLKYSRAPKSKRSVAKSFGFQTLSEIRTI